MIFETERLSIRKLKNQDFDAFHQMQSNINVMRYTDSPPKNKTENKLDLDRVISFYQKPKNSFWVFAVERKKDTNFIGTIAIIIDNDAKAEIGYRYLEKYWHNGYAFEALNGLINYAKELKLKELYGEVVVENKASEYLLKKVGFQFVKEYICEDLKLLERLYTLKL